MSRFLKFIIHLVIILMILDVVALAVPPFLGITTAIIDGSEQTNLATGSVTYARSVPVEDLQPGDMILVEENDSVYKYKINSIDTSSNVYNVYDQKDVDAGEISIALSGSQPEVVVTVPYIGYLIVATQSREGLIIIALVIVLLVILFILSELWRKDKPEEVQTEERQPGEEGLSDRQLKKKRKAELKQQEREEALYDRQQEREENQASAKEIKNKQKELRKEEKQRKKEKKKRARVGGFVEDYDPIETKSETPVISEEETATDEANQFLKQEVVAATAASSEETSDDQLSATQDLAEKPAAQAQEETPNVTSDASAEAASPETEETAKAPEAAKAQETEETSETDQTSETAKMQEPDKASEAEKTTETDKTSDTDKTQEPDKAPETDKTSDTPKTQETDKTSEAEKATETDKTSDTDKTQETVKPQDTDKTQETEETSETAKTEPSAASAEESVQTETAANDQPAQETPETESNTEQTQQPASEEGPVVYQKMAIPIYTEAELLEQARIAGEEPEVIRDEDLGITLLDYSRIIVEDTSGQGGETEDQQSTDG